MVSVAGLVFDEDAARGEIQAQLQGLMGKQGAGAVEGLLASVREPAEGLTVGGFLLVAFMFGLIYKVVPRQRVLAADVRLDALLAALLFTAGKVVIGAYIGRSGVASGFGAAGSLVVVLLWVYFSAQILLVGAEFTCVHARTFGSRSPTPPAPDARTEF